jgi:aspartate kinase
LKQVYKFGGSTIKSALDFKRIADVIIKADNLSFVVLSATYNTTNELEQIHKTGDLSLVDKLFDKHIKLCEELEIYERVSLHLSSLKTELEGLLKLEESPKRLDAIYSFGERLSTLILYFYLKDRDFNIELLDSREVIKTNSEFNDAGPLLFNIKELVSKLPKAIYLTQGFVGSNSRGETTTLGREGSDYTASLLAWALDVESMTVWKDVDGVYQTDPKRYADAKLVSEISYEQAEELTQKGAKILFSRTMNPLREKSIDLYVRSIETQNIGTKISNLKSNAVFIALDNEIVNIIGSNFFAYDLATHIEEKFRSQQFEYELFEYCNNVISYKINSQHLDSCVNLIAPVVFGSNS